MVSHFRYPCECPIALLASEKSAFLFPLIGIFRTPAEDEHPILRSLLKNESELRHYSTVPDANSVISSS